MTVCDDHHLWIKQNPRPSYNGRMTKDQAREQIPLILEGMREGHSLRKCCEAAGVVLNTFMNWINTDPALIEQYTQARASMLDAQAEALEDIGERAANATDAVEVAGLRLQSDNRKWLLSKLAPKKYGEKQQVEHSGEQTIVSIERKIVSSPD